MALSKKDNPEADKAVNDAIDAAAGAPAPERAAAEALPEGDEVEKAHKDALLADDAQEEAQAKVRVVDASPDASDTPSGHALKETAGIADDVERGEAYARAKAEKRWGYVTPDLQEK